MGTSPAVLPIKNSHPLPIGGLFLVNIVIAVVYSIFAKKRSEVDLQQEYTEIFRHAGVAEGFVTKYLKNVDGKNRDIATR